MSNTKQPTYEELMEMLQKERSKNAQLLKNIEEKDAQIANFKEVVAPILKEAFHSTSLIAKELNKYCFNIDDLLIKDLTEQIAFTADNLFKWANLAKSYFLQTPMAPTGKDLNGNIPPQGDVDLEKAKEFYAQACEELGKKELSINLLYGTKPSSSALLNIPLNVILAYSGSSSGIGCNLFKENLFLPSSIICKYPLLAK